MQSRSLCDANCAVRDAASASNGRPFRAVDDTVHSGRTCARPATRLPEVRVRSPSTGKLAIDPCGAVRSLAKHDQALRRYPFAKAHNYRLAAGSVSEMTERLALLRPHEIAEIESLARGRAEIITAGACVVNVVMDGYGFGELVVGAQGLREGTLAASLDFPRAFGGGGGGGGGASMPHAAEIEASVRAACGADGLPAAAAAVADPLIAAGALDARLRPVLAHSLRYMSMFTSLRNIENVIHLVLDEDSALSHQEQLVSALAIIHTRKKRRARILAARYSGMLGGADVSAPVRRVGALAELCDVLLATGAHPAVSVSGAGGGGKGRRRCASMRIELPPAGPDFPRVMLAEACSAVSAAFGMDVALSCPAAEGRQPA